MSDKYPGGFVTANAPAGFSVALDGSGDYLSLSSPLNFGTNAFTIEGWFYMSTTGQQGFWGESNGGGANPKCQLYIYPSNSLTLDVGTGTVSGISGLTASNYLKLNSWNHIVACRAGTGTNQTSLFINGVRVGNGTSGSVTGVTDNFKIGSNELGVMSAGYISSFRVINGTDIYGYSNTTITPQGGPFLQSTNAILLACQSPTIIDNSTNNFTITANGDAKVSNFTPFAAYQGFNPALGAAAGGVWTLDEAAYYQNNRQWPIYDPYFNQTTLMLHGNGTNAAQNNTFLDSSTNNFTITRSGNTTQGSFSPFSQTGWSNYFGSGNSLSLASNAAFAYGTGALTVEFWEWSTTTPTSAVEVWVSNGSNNLNIQRSSGGFYNVYDGTDRVSTTTVSSNQWNHVAFVRQTGGQTNLYVNGVSVLSWTSSVNYGNDTFLIAGSGSFPFPGYISNMRVVKGSAVYTSNFTPSTAPLTAVTGTSLLTCQSQRFVDNSANNFALTVNGTPSVQAFSPFVPAYITPITYSNWFDGSGDYLTAPNAAWMNLGTGSFTMECWVQFNTVSSTQMFVSNNYNAGTGGGGWAFLYRQDNTTLKFTCNSNVSYEKTWSPVVGTMYHVAVCRSGTDLRLFVNGTQIGTTSTSSDNISGASSTLVVGNNLGGTPLPINGVISNMRIVTSALYTSNFTPPTAPLTAISNTQLLTCQNSTFIDNSTNAATLTANGNVQPVASPNPFGFNTDQSTLNTAYSAATVGGSGYFDGSGDYLVSAGAVNWSTYTNLTVDFWVYPTNLSGGVQAIVGTCLADAYTFIYNYANGSIGVGINGVNEIASAAGVMKNSTWQHVAVVKVGSTTTIYVNGVSVASNTTAVWSNNSRSVYVGYNQSTSYTGYISGMRLTLGSALYTSNFVPPAAPPTAIANTSLLLNFTNAGIYDSASKNVLETVGNAQISTTQSKWGGSSMYFDGTGDYLQAPNSKISNFGGGDFTIEFWMYASSQALAPIVHQTSYSSTQGWIVWNYDGSNVSASTRKLTLMLNATFVLTTSADAYSDNTWTHIAVVKSGTGTNNIKIYSNGVVAATGTYATAVADATTPLMVGGIISGVSWNGTSYFNGYIDDLRITKGVARYITNFTPPTSQLQDQ